MTDESMLDSNIHLDIITRDPIWYDWSTAALDAAVRRGRVVINQVIYAELASGFHTANELSRAIPASDIERESIPWEAAFLAGRAFVQYRRSGGARPAPLPDFYIGAHAAVAGYTLLTRDPLRYRHYFPKLKVVAP